MFFFVLGYRVLRLSSEIYSGVAHGKRQNQAVIPHYVALQGYLLYLAARIDVRNRVLISREPSMRLPEERPECIGVAKDSAVLAKVQR